MNGPFKAYLTSVATKLDLDQGGREGQFFLRLLAEPRWTGFQYQRPVLVRARDNHGRTYTPKKAGTPKTAGTSASHWQTSAGNLVAFDDDWAATKVKVENLAAAATSVVEFVVDVPIRLVHSRRECNLAIDEKQLGGSVTQGDRVFTLKDIDSEGENLSLTVTIKSTSRAGWGAYEFHLARAGRKIGNVYSRATTTRPNGSGFLTEFELMASTAFTGKAGEPFELVISYPDRTSEKSIRFTFQDVALP